ncbi:MAG: hypothetical protein U1D00_17870 [Mycobacterium sp.]|nr:hypothetical protein [Mycobacterium sp.]
MSDPTPPPETSEPATGPVMTPPPAPPTAADPATPPPVYVQESNRLTKVAAWVGIVAGSVIVVAVIFGTGFFVGKEVGEGSRGHDRGNHMLLRPGMPMFPMAPRGDFERGPGFPGPFGPGGPMIEMPRSPGGQGGSGGSETTTAPPRP